MSWSYQRAKNEDSVGYPLPRHLTPASAEWSQLWTPTPLCEQSISRDSLPVQYKLSRNIPPIPLPK